jgi:hypothetical protein
LLPSSGSEICFFLFSLPGYFAWFILWCWNAGIKFLGNVSTFLRDCMALHLKILTAVAVKSTVVNHIVFLCLLHVFSWVPLHSFIGDSTYNLVDIYVSEERAASIFMNLFLILEMEALLFLQIVGKLTPDYTASHSRQYVSWYDN